MIYSLAYDLPDFCLELKNFFLMHENMVHMFPGICSLLALVLWSDTLSFFINVL